MKTLIALAALVGAVLLTAFVFGMMAVSFHNKEVKLRNLITAKQNDNKNEMDAMWKNISQTAQVAEKDRESLTQLFVSYAQGRNTGGAQSIFNWIKEACPKVDMSSLNFRKLMNIIVSQRDGFKFRQKELLDLKREHDNLLDTFPNNIFAGIMGRHKIDVVIVTSTRTDNAFKTGKDDDVKLFDKPATNAESTNQ